MANVLFFQKGKTYSNVVRLALIIIIRQASPDTISPKELFFVSITRMLRVDFNQEI